MPRTPSTINVKISRKKGMWIVTCKEMAHMLFEATTVHELRQQMELLPKIVNDHWYMEHKGKSPLREFDAVDDGEEEQPREGMLTRNYRDWPE